ncbi:MAG: hypothetical protein U9R00_03455 [Patescibacteria group bacterium]|nr:hypothetical protein [Patescibacteria group bacterium]
MKCINCKKEFEITGDDLSFYKKMKVPEPTFCPDCRRQRRLAYRNDFVFYNRKCDLCQRDIISIYSLDNPQTIYCNKCWWSDNWDPKEYAQDFDFSRSFFEQFTEFRRKVPALALVNDNNIGSVNCDYTQDLAYSKDCYMAMVCWKMQNCLYFCYGANTKDGVDSMGIFNECQGIYEVIYSGRCFGSKYIQQSNELMNCAFCHSCRNCQNCFMSVNLVGKKYCFKNEQYTKEEYEKILESYNLDTCSGVEKAKKEFNEFLLTQPLRFASQINCFKCDGHNIFNSKNSKHVFHSHRSEDSKYLENGDVQKNSYDLSVGGELEQCYEGLTPDHSHRTAFVVYTWKSLDIMYSDFCMSCQECFGSAGLKHTKYAIFNKQYTKEEYFKLKDKIIDYMKKTGEYGEFFPIEMSPFAYNESMAQMQFPMTKEEVLKKGLKWQDNVQQTKGKATIGDVPDNINDVDDSILKEILECKNCQRNYKLLSEELTFYRKWKIPIPRKCFFCRLNDRFKLRGPSTLWHRKCMNNGCDNEFETSYDPKRPEIIYCKSCYQKEVL